MTDRMGQAFQYFDGDLGDEETRALEAAILEDSSVREAFVQAAQLEYALHEQCRRQDGVIPAGTNSFTDPLLRELLAMEASSVTIPPPMDPEALENAPPARRSPWLLASAAFGATAAVLMFGTLVWFIRHPPARPASNNVPATPIAYVATIARSMDAVWGGRTPLLDIGDGLSMRRYELISGAVELHFRDGATTIVEGPSVFAMSGADEVHLEHGVISAEAASGTFGFTVTTPNSRVVDLGTAFGVSVSDDGAVDLAVFDGAVQVEPPRSMHDAEGGELSPLRVNEGEAASWTLDDAQPEIVVPLSRGRRNRFTRTWDEFVLRPRIRTAGVEYMDRSPAVLSPKWLEDGWPERGVYLEKAGIVLTTDLRLDVAQPGTFHTDKEEAAREEGQLLPAGTRVNVYLVRGVRQVDAVRGLRQYPFRLEFNAPILGVQWQTESLQVTDKSVIGVEHRRVGSGMDANDSIELGADMRSIKIDMTLENPQGGLKWHADDVRIFTVVLDEQDAG